jgi:hypothetical protein
MLSKSFIHKKKPISTTCIWLWKDFLKKGVFEITQDILTP